MDLTHGHRAVIYYSRAQHKEKSKTGPSKELIQLTRETTRERAVGRPEEACVSLLSTAPQTPGSLSLCKTLNSLTQHPKKPLERREECKANKKIPCLLPAIFSHVRCYPSEEQSFISVLITSLPYEKLGGNILAGIMKGCK